MHPQLTLPLGVSSSSSFDAFYPGEANAAAFNALTDFCVGKLDEQQLFFWGGNGTGKTHLLSAACQSFSHRGYQAAFITGELASQDFALQGLESFDLLCVDDIHLLNNAAEETMFHCVNRCRESATRLIFSANSPVDDIELSLRDLKTRLQWGTVFQLHALNDEELPNAVLKLFEQKSLQVENDVVDYVLRRFPRNMTSLRQLVDKLDQASLQEQRRVTIPLVRQLSESME